MWALIRVSGGCASLCDIGMFCLSFTWFAVAAGFVVLLGLRDDCVDKRQHVGVQETDPRISLIYGDSASVAASDANVWGTGYGNFHQASASAS
jgi:hypothetical protein